MLNQSNQTTLEMRLSLYLHDISDRDKQFRLNLIEYWLSDSDFSDIETEQDIAYSFSAIFRVIEGENNPENKTKVFQEWFSLLGLYFLGNNNISDFSERRRIDFAGFCLFSIENFGGGYKTVQNTVQTDALETLSEVGNDAKYRQLREFKAIVIKEYLPAAELLWNRGQSISHKSIASVVWPKVSKFNVGKPNRALIRAGKDDDPQGRIVRWFQEAVTAGDIPSTKTLRKTPPPWDASSG